MTATARPRSAAQARATPSQPSALVRNGMVSPGRTGKGSSPAGRATDRATTVPGDRTRQAGRRSTVVAAPVDARSLPRPSTRDVPAGRVVKGPVRERHEADPMVILATIGLAAMGVLMSYSTGAAAIGTRPDALQTVLGPEIIWVTLGVGVMAFMSRVDYRYLRLFSVVAFGVVLLLLAFLVFKPQVGPISVRQVGDAARWLVIGGSESGGGFSFHPAELGKLGLIIYLAHWMARRGSSMGSLVHGTIPFLVIAGAVIALVALEPDLGTTGVITLTAFTMLFVAGGNIWHLALLLPAGLVAVGMYIQTNDYQMQRWQTFFDPWSQAADQGYQTVQGLLSLGMGGVLGTGLGTSQVPGGLHLPNADNDFVFAMVGQELGMAGALLVVGLFVVLAWRGISIARHAPDTFGALLAIGVSVCLVFQAFINIGVVIQLLPLTGITLPFLSSGNSSLLVSFAGVGILLSVSRETVREEQEARGTIDDAHHGRGRGHWRPHLPGARRAPDAGAATTGS